MKNDNLEHIADLVALVKEQDPDAFVELYNCMYQRVYFLALSIVKDEYLAQDVVQETFINVYRSIKTLKEDITFLAWINRITYHCSLKTLSKNGEISMESDLVERESLLIDSDEPLKKVLSNEKKQTIMNFILSLPPEYKTTMILKYYEDLKMEEIASVLECSVGTVKSRLSRGKNLLRKKMHSREKILALFAVSSISIAGSIKSYAKGLGMTESLAAEALEASKLGLGITSCLCIQMPVPAVCTLSAVARCALIGSSALLCASGGFLAIEKPTIVIHNRSSGYTNTAIEVSVEVKSVAPVKTVSVISEEKGYPIYKAEAKERHEISVDKNGWYRVEAVSWNGIKTTKRFEITTLDMTVPKLYWYSWSIEKNTLYGLIEDDQSGIDYSRIYKVDESGNKQQPIRYNESTGEVEFPLSEDYFHIQLYDKANNFATYRVESYKIEP